MKKIITVYFFLVSILSCNQRAHKNNDHADSADIFISDSTHSKIDQQYYWEVSYDLKRGMRFIKTFPIPADSLNIHLIMAKLNFNYPKVKVEFLKQSYDTLFLKIRDATFLTHQMGSSGAQAYLGELTYNLTEIPDIHFIDLQFKEGDHANPGIFSRTDFNHFEN